MAQLSVQAAALAGTAVTFAAAAGGGDSFPNDGKTVFHVRNGGGGAITVTANSQAQCSYGFDHDVAVTVDASAHEVIGPFSAMRFNDSSSLVQITYSGVTTVTVAAVRVTPAQA